MTATQVPKKQLELVREAKISISSAALDPRLEASSVVAKDGAFYVIFDNMPHIAFIGAELPAAAGANQVIEQHEGHGRGFEEIAYDPLPLEYSIGWLICAIASTFDVVMVGLPGAAQDRLPAHVPGTRYGRPGVPW